MEAFIIERPITFDLVARVKEVAGQEVLPGDDLVPGSWCLVHLDPPVLLRFCPKLAAETIRVIADPDTRSRSETRHAGGGALRTGHAMRHREANWRLDPVSDNPDMRAAYPGSAHSFAIACSPCIRL